ncbi:hypothetical protein MPSEU_000893200 [Mayamaea pseudoterrestris]|nr:hypothetical protein MPSEU_000893200 [Mayamaea pseudoterrestris]
MSKKRAGFQAAAHLILTENALTWERVDDRFDQVIHSITNLRAYHDSLRIMAEQLSKDSQDMASISKNDLLQIVGWKHRVGQNRAYNVKLIQANTDSIIESHSHAAIILARKIDATTVLTNDGELNVHGQTAVREPLSELMILKGVGPATASAVLMLIRPDVFCYMYDEVIDCFETARDYTLSQYVRINSRCLQIAQKLGLGWTTSRVARAIWTAAREMAMHGIDLSQDKAKDTAGHSKIMLEPTSFSNNKRKAAILDSCMGMGELEEVNVTKDDDTLQLKSSTRESRHEAGGKAVTRASTGKRKV